MKISGYSLPLVMVIPAIFISLLSVSQPVWQNVDSLFQPLPPSVHIYKTTIPVDGKPNVAYYASIELGDKSIAFDTDTTKGRRLTPQQFYHENGKPLVVVNSTFFSFATNQNLNIVIKDSKLAGYNVHTINGRGKDTFTYRHPFGSAIGISKQRKADVAWLYTDSLKRFAYASQVPVNLVKDSLAKIDKNYFRKQRNKQGITVKNMRKWKMETAVGGGPVLVQNGKILITNDQELKFGGKAVYDKHPRTAMGYTVDNRLIIMVVEGRHPGIAEGTDLYQTAKLLQDIGCIEALNLDGGGSSCMLVNGKPTITVSDLAGQRPVPCVFMVTNR